MKQPPSQRRPDPSPAPSRQHAGRAIAAPQTAVVAETPTVAEQAPLTESLTQLATSIDASPRTTRQREIANRISGSPLSVGQRRRIERFTGDTVQRAGDSAESAPLQSAAPDPAATRSTEGPDTGLPPGIQSGIESLSGISMNHVRVHYNSSQPAQLNAHAFAQGRDIHVAPGQERHLPHEAWHVVQQAQGRVRPTMQLKAGTPINDDPGLEQEADAMGTKALQLAGAVETGGGRSVLPVAPTNGAQAATAPLQAKSASLDKLRSLQSEHRTGLTGMFYTVFSSKETTFDKIINELSAYEKSKDDMKTRPRVEQTQHKQGYMTYFAYLREEVLRPQEHRKKTLEEISSWMAKRDESKQEKKDEQKWQALLALRTELEAEAKHEDARLKEITAEQETAERELEAREQAIRNAPADAVEAAKEATMEAASALAAHQQAKTAQSAAESAQTAADAAVHSSAADTAAMAAGTSADKANAAARRAAAAAALLLESAQGVESDAAKRAAGDAKAARMAADNAIKAQQEARIAARDAGAAAQKKEAAEAAERAARQKAQEEEQARDAARDDANSVKTIGAMMQDKRKRSDERAKAAAEEQKRQAEAREAHANAIRNAAIQSAHDSRRAHWESKYAGSKTSKADKEGSAGPIGTDKLEEYRRLYATRKLAKPEEQAELKKLEQSNVAEKQDEINKARDVETFAREKWGNKDDSKRKKYGGSEERYVATKLEAANVPDPTLIEAVIRSAAFKQALQQKVSEINGLDPKAGPEEIKRVFALWVSLRIDDGVEDQHWSDQVGAKTYFHQQVSKEEFAEQQAAEGVDDEAKERRRNAVLEKKTATPDDLANVAKLIADRNQLHDLLMQIDPTKISLRESAESVEAARRLLLSIANSFSNQFLPREFRRDTGSKEERLVFAAWGQVMAEKAAKKAAEWKQGQKSFSEKRRDNLDDAKAAAEKNLTGDVVAGGLAAGTKKVASDMGSTEHAALEGWKAKGDDVTFEEHVRNMGNPGVTTFDQKSTNADFLNRVGSGISGVADVFKLLKTIKEAEEKQGNEMTEMSYAQVGEATVKVLGILTELSIKVVSLLGPTGVVVPFVGPVVGMLECAIRSLGFVSRWIDENRIVQEEKANSNASGLLGAMRRTRNRNKSLAIYSAVDTISHITNFAGQLISTLGPAGSIAGGVTSAISLVMKGAVAVWRVFESSSAAGAQQDAKRDLELNKQGAAAAMFEKSDDFAVTAIVQEAKRAWTAGEKSHVAVRKVKAYGFREEALDKFSVKELSDKMMELLEREKDAKTLWQKLQFWK